MTNLKLRQSWSKDLVITMLQSLAVDGVVSSVNASKMSNSLPTMARRFFGNFENACCAARVVSISAKPKHTTCTVSDCNKLVRSVGASLCHMHYSRIGRTGIAELLERVTLPKYIHTSGYISVMAKNHILSYSNNLAYEHRVVYYATYGDGPFACNWCAKMVTWLNLHIDHVDDCKSNNDIKNLVASCSQCNIARGLDKMIATCQSNGTNITFHGITRHISLWAKDLEISGTTLRYRLANWSLERALTEPRNKSGPSKQCHKDKTSMEATDRATKRRKLKEAL